MNFYNYIYRKFSVLGNFFQNFKYQNTKLLKSIAFNKHFETQSQTKPKS